MREPMTVGVLRRHLANLADDQKLYVSESGCTYVPLYGLLTSEGDEHILVGHVNIKCSSTSKPN